MLIEKKTCNLCAKEFNTYDYIEDISICTRAGYGTKYDGQTIRIDICCECFEKLIDKCKVDPVVEDTVW